jgi:large subunit ribosomal protein L20
MVRVTGAPASRRRRKRVLKRAKGFYGDRKSHIKQSSNAVMSALSFNYRHRKLKKRDFRSLWITRLGIAAKIHGLSYSKLIHGLKKAGCEMNRKMLSELAIHDKESFKEIVGKAKEALAA